MAEPTSSSPRLRRLTTTEIDSYDVLPNELASRVRVIRVPILFGRYAGMTLGRYILLRREVPADGWSRLLVHELVHVRQWAELGVVGFAYRYTTQFGRGLVRTKNWNRAYLGIEVEREARELSEEWQQRRNLRPPDS